MSRNALKIDLFRILSQNGFAFTNQEIDAFADRLEAEQFNMDESGSFWSPAGESLVSAVYRGWSDTAPVTAPNKPTADADKRYTNGLTDSDIASIKDPFRRAEVQAEVEGGCRVVPSWQRGPNAPVTVAEICQRTGLSPEAFAKLPPTRKLEVENEVKFARGNGGANV